MPENTPARSCWTLLWTRRCVCLLVLALWVVTGCNSAPQQEDDVPLPGFGDEGPARPQGVYAVIRRADVPLDESTDDAWAIINEQIVPPVTRGIWRGNGLRVGLLPKDKLDAYSKAMPQPVGFSRVMINKSDYPVPIIETATLRDDLRLTIDLTRPPRPRSVQTIKGGDNSTLRLLARIVAEDDGRHTLVLTPQHYIPSPFDLIPRDPLVKEMDGRVYEELTIRLTPGQNQIAVIGLHWPWPMKQALPDVDSSEQSPASDPLSNPRPELPAAEPRDPAAPPPHISPPTDRNAPTPDADGQADKDKNTDNDDTPEPEPTYKRIAPPLPTTFGSTLLTGTRIRQPVRSVLLITIEEPDTTQTPPLDIDPEG